LSREKNESPFARKNNPGTVFFAALYHLAGIKNATFIWRRFFTVGVLTPESRGRLVSREISISGKLK